MKNCYSSCNGTSEFIPKILRIMKVTTLLIILGFSSIFATNVHSQTEKVSLALNNSTLKQVLLEIEKQSSYNFFYNDHFIDLNQKINVNLRSTAISEVLKELFNNTNLTYKVMENRLIIITPKTLIDKVKVRGKVTSARDHTPLIGVTIIEKGTKKGTVTDVNGNFALDVSSTKAILLVSYIGMKKMEVEVNGQSELNIEMTDEISQLGAVTVVSTGYQTISKERATGSFSVVSPKDLRGKLQMNITDRIEGMVAGLTSYKGSIQIRGVSTLTSSQKSPLYVVDGIPYEGSLSAINPDDVASVTVLKDATAASIYGARSANGVIVIVTKSGVAGPVRINVNSTLKFTPLPDRSYFNRMSSEELVNFQYDMFQYNSGNYASIDPRKAMNDVYRQLYERKAGNITEDQLQQKLDVYRHHDRYDQVVDEMLRKNAVDQQNNISFSGGSDFYKYNLSANYLQTNPYERKQKSERFGFNLKNSFNLTKWMKADIGILGSNTASDYDNGFTGYGYLNGGKASYYMLKDDNGNNAQWYSSKTQYEIDRLNSLGLQDETYKPLDELSRQHFTASSKYLNLNIGVNFKIFDGLSLDLKYQKERTENYSKQLYDKNSLVAKTMINDATLIQTDGKVINYIPTGGQINETRGDLNSYTLRAQLNYSQSFNKLHDIQVIAGGEQRKVVSTATNVYKYGYDDSSLNYKAVDELFLSQYLYGTQSIYNQFLLSRAESGFRNVENRFVAFYGNASYTFNKRITASASIRMDQSNLFGTDPKYQYKPLWSAGLLYVVPLKQVEWIDRLAVRATYGINGNIAKDSGPYLISRDESSTNYYTNEVQAYISSPPNSGLRWEKTAVTNLAIDFRLFKNRLSGSIEYYNKDTKDLLASLMSDPTIGWSSTTVNYGSMFNRGIDISLTSDNLTSDKVRWSTTLNFNYNKNELTSLQNSSNTVSTYISSAQNRVGKPMGALYSVNYAGLNNLGRPKALKADGTVVTNLNNLAVSDLIYNGTVTPPFSASLSNTISYKGFELFFMFIYYGGNVMRDVQSVYLSKLPELNYTSNMDRNVLNYWKKAGDELNPNVSPGYYASASYLITNLWDASNNNIQKADYIKLRDVTLSYSLPESLLNKYSIKGVRFSLQIQNLWRWSANRQNLDPEVWDGTSITTSRGTLIPPTYTVGLSLNF